MLQRAGNWGPNGDLRRYFRERLGWDRTTAQLQVVERGREYVLAAVAQKRGFLVFECEVTRLELRNRPLLRRIEWHLSKQYHEHVIVFHNGDTSDQVWQWATWAADRSRFRHREHPVPGGHIPQELAAAIESLEVRLEEEEDLSLTAVLSRVAEAFDQAPATGIFFRNPRYAEESERLALAMQSGRQSDFDRFVLFHQRLALWVAKRFLRTGIDPDDLAQIAYIGLIEAARRFDPQLGTAFSTYAVFWIRQVCQRYVPSHVRRVFIRDDVYWRFRRLLRRVAAARRRHGELSAMRVETKALQELPSLIGGMAGIRRVLHATLIDDDPTGEDWRRDAVSNEPWPDGTVELADSADLIHQAIDALPEKAQFLLKSRLGLEGEGRTLQDLAEEVGLTRERVRQICEDSMEKIRWRTRAVKPDGWE